MFCDGLLKIGMPSMSVCASAFFLNLCTVGIVEMENGSQV